MSDALDDPAAALDGLLRGLERFLGRMQHDGPGWLSAQLLRPLGNAAIQGAVPNDHRAWVDRRALLVVGGRAWGLRGRDQVDLDRDLTMNRLSSTGVLVGCDGVSFWMYVPSPKRQPYS